MSTYGDWLIAKHDPLMLFLLDTLPDYNTALPDASGNGYDGSWGWTQPSDRPDPALQAAIFGNGDGSAQAEGWYALVNHDLPEHQSWTASALLFEVGGTGENGWAAAGVLQRYFPPQPEGQAPLFDTGAAEFPAWSVGTQNVTATDDPLGAACGLAYRTSFATVAEAATSGILDMGSEHWLAWRFKASARELSLWVDGEKVGAKTLAYVPQHPTTQRLNLLAGVQDTAASHVVYWARALSDADLAEIADVAINGLPPDVPETITLQPWQATTKITGSITLQTRIDVDGGPP